MEAIEKAKLALKKYLLENKDSVARDLEEMRKKSTGRDIFQYVDSLSSAFSFENITSTNEVVYEYFSQDISYYELLDDFISRYLYSPPKKENRQKSKKDPDKVSGSFFFG